MRDSHGNIIDPNKMIVRNGEVISNDGINPVPNIQNMGDSYKKINSRGEEEFIIGDNIYADKISPFVARHQLLSANAYMFVTGALVYDDSRYDNSQMNRKDNFNPASMEIKTGYFNFTNQKYITAVNRQGFKFPININGVHDLINFLNGYRTLNGIMPQFHQPTNQEKNNDEILNSIYNHCANKLVIVSEYNLNYETLNKMHQHLINNKFESIDDNFTKFIALLSKNNIDYFDIINGANKDIKIKVLIIYFIDADKLINDSHMLCRIKQTGDIFYFGEYDNCPVKSVSSTNLDFETSTLFKENDVKEGNFIKVINNSGGSCNYYYWFGNEIKTVKSEVNPNLSDGIHIFNFELKDVFENNTVSKKYKLVDKIIPFSQAEENHFYSSYEYAKNHGNFDANMKLELNKINNEKISLENTKIQMTKDLHEKDMELANLKSQLEITKIEKDKVLEELKLEKAKEMAQLDIEKTKTTNYYTERSLDRKDTSESIKMMPAVIGAVAGIVGVSVGLVAKRAAIGAAATTGGVLTTLMVVGAYEIFRSTINSKIVKSIGKTLYNGAKSLASTVYNGACAVGRAAVNVVGCVSSFVGNTVSSVLGGISDFVFGF